MLQEEDLLGEHSRKHSSAKANGIHSHSETDVWDLPSMTTKCHFASVGLSGRTGDWVVNLCNRGFQTVEMIRRFFGKARIEDIELDELVQAISVCNPSIVLVDVRSLKEQSVSKIPRSISSREFQMNLEKYKNNVVVPYCTVGGRSYLYAVELTKAGIDCRNFRAGILGWCRAGLPLATPDGKPTSNVNTYWRIFQVPCQYTFQKHSEQPRKQRIDRYW
jgi:rhodanese-related sulfurtransferase